MGLLSLFRRTKRRNWHKRVAGTAVGVPSVLDMHGLKLGMQQHCVIPVKCGCCRESWEDALQPKKPTELRCPHCGALNQVTWHFELHVVG